ncbi:SUPpressor [Caenorhabditis elegans]|uniref:SUPpressor n=1 Tax=Caenorhabditis elegans TaxID=6239 RepID=Q94207_CAEEL|nr:SUPpressor [Caenorhabditis elegans]CCD67174.1 SUPpressor [Caenorhabditis elegans]|eukprot:NP_501015.1 SUPpressor [Caenorhabditis elegans]
MPSCEIKFDFNDSDESVTVRETRIILLLPVIRRAVELQYPDFATEENAVIEAPFRVPFKKDAGVFLFDTIARYAAPTDDNVHEITVEQSYPEAGPKTLDELKEIIELANFWECTTYMECIGFAIAKKLEDKTIEEIAAFMGVECNPPGNFFAEEDGWIHPPADAFQNVQ